jgi:hypothetical protein
MKVKRLVCVSFALVFILACAGFFLFSCGDIGMLDIPKPKPYMLFDQTLFDSERAAWEAQNIQNYEFQLRMFLGPDSDDCSDIFHFVVENGVPKSRKVLNGYDGYYPDGVTISELYAEIEQSVAELRKNIEEGNIPGGSMWVYYDLTYHVPIRWYMTLAEVMADCVESKIKNFQIINSENVP